MSKDDPMDWFELGVGHDVAGRPAEAADAYQRAVELRPSFGEAWHNLGEAYLKLHDAHAAADAFRNAQPLLPRRAEPGIGLSRAQRALGDGKAARATLEALSGTRGGDPRVWNELGMLRRELGDLPGALAAYRQALALDLHNADAHHNLGNALAASGDLPGAISAYRNALADRPGFVGAWLSLAAVQSHTGDIAGATASCERALALAPNLARAHAQLAQVLSWSFEPAQLERAVASARRALELDPNRADAYGVACLVLRKLGRLGAAITAGRGAVERAPTEAQYRIDLAAALLEHGDARAAAVELEAAVEHAPHDALAWRELGLARLRSGDPEQGHRALARAASLDPHDQNTTSYRIVCLEAQGERRAAAALSGTERFFARFALEPPPGWDSVASFNAALAADIAAHPSLKFEPAGLAAKGGSLAQDLMSARTPAIEAFERWLRARIAEFRAGLPDDGDHPFTRMLVQQPDVSRWKLSMWATLLHGGGEIATHIHEESWLSGAYYVEVPDAAVIGEGHAGWFEHGRPWFAIAGHEPELGFVRPEPGLLLLFPSYLYHRTVPFAAAGQRRISISFDLTPPGLPQRRRGGYGAARG